MVVYDDCCAKSLHVYLIDWTQMQGYGFLPQTQLAVQYLRFAMGDGFYSPIQGRCSFITRG